MIYFLDNKQFSKLTLRVIMEQYVINIPGHKVFKIWMYM